MRSHPPFQLMDRSPLGMMTPAYLSLYWSKHVIYGLLEVDVTRPRHLIAEHRAATGETISFTAFLVHCVARAVEENKQVHGYLKGRRHLVLFDDVDVFVPVERRTSDGGVPVPLIVRGANRKHLRAIHEEIRAAQTAPSTPGSGAPPLMQRLLAGPWPVPGLTVRLIRRLSRLDPGRLVRAAGTVGVTALGMVGRSGGWGLAPGGQSLLLIVGAIAPQPWVVDGAVEAREILHLTVAFDHDVVDGAPAARFTERLTELVRTADGLPLPVA